METLPTEVLQHVAWFSFNPELYLVSKTIASKLPPVQDYEYDLILLLFCARSGEGEVWTTFRPFPWHTPQARLTDFRLSREARLDLQRVILNQSWATHKRLKRALVTVTRLYLSKWLKPEQLSEEETEALDKCLDLVAPMQLQILITSTSINGESLRLGPDGLSVVAFDNDDRYTRTVHDQFEVFYIPDKILTAPRTEHTLAFFHFLSMFLPRYEGSTPGDRNNIWPRYSKDTLQRTLIECATSNNNNDEKWLRTLLAAENHRRQWDPQDNFLEVGLAIARARRWDRMTVLRVAAARMQSPDLLVDNILSALLSEPLPTPEDEVTAVELLSYVKQTRTNNKVRRTTWREKLERLCSEIPSMRRIWDENAAVLN